MYFSKIYTNTTKIYKFQMFLFPASEVITIEVAVAVIPSVAQEKQ